MMATLLLAVDGAPAPPALSFWQMVVLAAAGGGTLGITGGGLITWLVKKLVNSLAESNRSLTKTVAEQLQASTIAFSAFTKALQELTAQIQTRARLDDERYSRLFSQLDRIEAKRH